MRNEKELIKKFWKYDLHFGADPRGDMIGSCYYNRYPGRPKNEYLLSYNKDDLIIEIIKNFDLNIFHRSIIPYSGGEIVLKKYLERVKPEICLEIGTFNGIPSLYMSKYCKKVITIDIVDQEIKYDLWKYFKVDNIDFYLVKNENEKRELINGLKFNFCLMDGDHENYSYSDFDLVKKCGNVLFHEYWIKQPAVKNLVDNLKPEKGKYIEIDQNYPFAFYGTKK